MRATKRKLTGEERREKIIAACMELFSRKGFAATTTRDIGRAAGISEALIYSYFKDKQDLYDAIIEEKMKEAEPLYYPSEAVEKKDDLEVFRTIVGNFVRRLSEDDSFLRLLLFSALEGNDLTRTFVAGPVGRFYEFLSGYISDRIEEGAFKPVEPMVAARGLMGMAVYFILQRDIYGDESLEGIGEEEIVDSILAIFCQGIFKGR